MLTAAVKTVCFVVCHAGPADHFATFEKELVQEGYEVRVYASGPAAQKLAARGVSVFKTFSADNLSEKEETLLAEEIANEVASKASIVFTDVGHHFNIALQNSLKDKNLETIAYCDNSEFPSPFLPEQYLNTATKVMEAAKRILFANANAEKDPNISVPFEKRIGLGYYPTEAADVIGEKRRLSGDRLRLEFLTKLKLEEKTKKILVFFGGNNEEYFNEAFPAFLRFLSQGAQKSDLSEFLVVLQQHPGAKSKNRDGLLLQNLISSEESNPKAPKIIISDKSTDEMLVIADGALYHQTSMGPLLALAGIPMIQVGNKPYEDLIIKAGFCPSVTDSSKLTEAMFTARPTALSPDQRARIFAGLGIRQDWKEVLKASLRLESTN